MHLSIYVFHASTPMHAYNTGLASLVRNGVLCLPGGLMQGLTRSVLTQERLNPHGSFQKSQPEIAPPPPQLKPITEEVDFANLHPQEGQEAGECRISGASP